MLDWAALGDGERTVRVRSSGWELGRGDANSVVRHARMLAMREVECMVC